MLGHSNFGQLRVSNQVKPVDMSSTDNTNQANTSNISNTNCSASAAESKEQSKKHHTSPPQKQKQFKSKLLMFVRSLEPWTGHINVINGCFGSGVASYFRFIRGLLLLNVPMLLISVGFVVCPQIIYRWVQQEPVGYTGNVSFTGAELLTGAGWFEETELYYGYYLNGSVNVTGVEYDMRFAYLCASTCCYLLTLVAVCFVLSVSYKNTSVHSMQIMETSSSFTVRLLGAWDHTIMSRRAASLRSKSIFTEIKEHLSDSSNKAKVEDNSKRLSAKLIIVRILVNVSVVGVLAGCGYLVWYLMDTQALENNYGVLSLLAMPLCMSGLNYISPFLFTAVVLLERYTDPRVPVYLTMIRTVVLNFTTLGVFVASWFIHVDQCSSSSSGESASCPPCWETKMGEELYSLIVIDFLFVIVGTFLTEFIWSLISRCCCSGRLNPPEFDVGLNMLNIIYSQTLVWLGMYFSPLLSLVMLVKLILLFYIKRVSVAMNCSPPKRAWKAGSLITFLYLLVFVTFLLCFGAVAYAVIGLQPSQSCGPFQEYNYTYDIFYEVIKEGTENNEHAQSILDAIFSTAFLVLVSLAMLVTVYYSYMYASGHNEVAEMLHKRVALEREERCFLLDILQNPSKYASVTSPQNTINAWLSNHHSDSSLNHHSDSFLKHRVVSTADAADNPLPSAISEE